VSDFRITYQSREWLEYEGATVPASATAQFPMTSSLVPNNALELTVGYHFPEPDAKPQLAYFEVHGGFTRQEFKNIDPFAFIEILISKWTDDPQFKALPKKIEIEVTSPGLAGQARQRVREIELEDVALVYLLSPSRGTQNVMEQLGYRSKTTAIRRVMDARKAGLIPPPESSAEEFQKARERIQKKRAR
jgi:hypothetical protein